MTTAGLLITGRLKSQRLPFKVLKPIHGRPMFEHLVARLRLARRPAEIVLCTSPVAQDDPLAELAEKLGLGVYRGDPDDVLLRLTEAARQFDFDHVISCTADNPFVDPEYVDRLCDFHRDGGYDYTATEGLPFGTFSYALRRGAMERALELKDTADTEVWGGYFTQTGEFRTGILKVTDPSVRQPDLRLTVDEEADFQLVTALFDALGGDGRIFSLAEIVAHCRAHPELTAINAHVQQKPGLPIRLKQGG